MKKMKKSLMILILFLMYANNIYATTTGTYVVSNKGNGLGKFFLLIVGVGLVSLVLFIGYIMDKNENTKRKREKFIKKQSNSDIFSRNYRNHKVDEWVEKYKATNDYDNETTDDEYEEQEENEDEENEDETNYYTQEIKLIREYDKDEEDEKKVEDIERDLIEKYVDEEKEEMFEKETQEAEEIIIEDNDYTKNTDIVELMNSTMVFNSNELRNTEFSNDNSVKGYDYEEDEDLSELEEIIKAANIKRYTRKKQPGNELLVKPKKKVIVFTKNKDENDIISQTRKKIQEIKESQKPRRGRPPKNKAEETEESKEIKQPAKRGRKPGSKNKPKEPAKRGRKPGSKNKTTTGKKRGRPPKNKAGETEESKEVKQPAKRGRPPKNK